MRKDGYTSEQMSWLKENYPKMGTTIATKEFNKTFNQNRTWDAIRTLCRRNKIRCNNEILSKRGRNNAKKYIPINSIIESSQGYLYIKINDIKNVKKSVNYQLLHHYIWEHEKGNIPENHVIIFLDGDRKNCSIKNLATVPQSYNTLMMKYNLKSENQEITKTAIEWCKLYEKLRKQGLEPKQYI